MKPIKATLPSVSFLLLAGGLLFVTSGCSTYLPPGEKADLRALAPTEIHESFAAKPTHPFPASIATVRVQGPAYTNFNLSRNGGRYGTGRYSIVTTREVEEQAQFDRITALPQVSAVVALNRLLLSEKLESDRELRAAAARLQADLVLVYTFDTAFFDHDAAKPLSVITLGLSPTRKITAITTISALLLDTRTGYVYSAYEVTERASTISTSWGTNDSADAVRRSTEKKAFAKLIDDFTTSWPALLSHNSRTPISK